MRKIRVGDKVDMHDGSYCFGIQNGQYTEDCNHKNGDREGLRVVAIDLDVMCNAENGDRSGKWDSRCDLLVTNGDGDFWFIRSQFVSLCEHEIIIDGQKIAISGKSFESLRKQLCK